MSVPNMRCVAEQAAAFMQTAGADGLEVRSKTGPGDEEEQSMVERLPIDGASRTEGVGMGPGVFVPRIEARGSDAACEAGAPLTRDGGMADARIQIMTPGATADPPAPGGPPRRPPRPRATRASGEADA